jgi:hypothetical protein
VYLVSGAAIGRPEFDVAVFARHRHCGATWRHACGNNGLWGPLQKPAAVQCKHVATGTVCLCTAAVGMLLSSSSALAIAGGFRGFVAYTSRRHEMHKERVWRWGLGQSSIAAARNSVRTQVVDLKRATFSRYTVLAQL